MDNAHLKNRFLQLIEIFSVFAYFYIIGRRPYFLIWISKRHFLFLWIVAAVLILINQKIVAKWVMIGCFWGIPVADIAEKANRIYFEGTDYFNRVFLGLPCWILFFGVCVVIGCVKQIKYRKIK